VREAISQLAAEGLVDIAPNRTRKVAGVTQKSALELMDVMELLACAGFAWGVDNLTANDVARIRQRYTDFTAALDRGDVTAASAARAYCGTIVVMASGNRELQALIDLVVTRSMRMLALGAHSDMWTPWRRGYGDVVEMLERGANDEAVTRYRQIYRDNRNVLEEALWHQRS
jgi:DNA-binding GntR family transcriptional regulator